MKLSPDQRGRRRGASRSGKPAGRPRPRYCRLGCEALESRRMLSVSLSLNGAQTITPGATIDVTTASGGNAGWQTEMSLVVNPTNPLNVVGFSHNINAPITLSVYTSFDGGLSWADNQIDNGDDGLGAAGNRFDPAVIFDANGTLYIMYGHRETNQTRLIAARSLDGGTTFGQFRTVDLQTDRNANTPGVDKWYIASGRDPISGNQAVVGAYVHFALEGPAGTTPDDRIKIVGTRDGGNTWTLPLTINDDTALLGTDSASYASPIIDNLGRLAVSWHDFDETSIMIDRDTDGLWSNAATFGNDVTVRTGVDVLRAADKPPAQPQRGINAAPMLEVWRATNFLYMPVVQRFGAGADFDIWVGRSTDFGDSWIFNRIDDSTGTEFNPWLQVDQTSGTVNVLYYTTDGDVGTGNDDVRPRLALSNDGGVTWTRNFLSTLTSNETSGAATDNDYLEYIGLGVRDGTAHGLWSSRYAGGGNDLDAFTANAAFVSSTGDNRLFIGESGGVDDTFLIRQSPVNPAFLEVFVDGIREFTGLAATLDKIIINPGGGLNTFNIGTLTGISSVTINGTNVTDTYDIVSLGLGAPLTIVLGGGDDTVTLGSSPFASQVILSPVSVFGDAGNDTLILGSNNGDSIDANVSFTGGASLGGAGDRIIFNDTAPAYNISYDITPTFVTRDGANLPRTVSYASTEGIVINAGSGADTVILRNAVAPLVTANGNNGNDNFIVGGGNMTGFVPQTFNGGPGTDQITFDDSLDPTNRIWDVRANEVLFGGLISLGTTAFESVGLLAGTGADEITFAQSIQQNLNVDAGSGSDTITIGFNAQCQFFGTTTINGGLGDDAFTWKNGSNNWYELIFGPIKYDVNLIGGTGYNTLSVDDTTRGNTSYQFYADRIYAFEPAVFPAGADFNYSGMKAIGLTASNGGNALSIFGSSSDIDVGNQVSISLNGGNDAVTLYPHDALGNLTINGNLGIGGGSGSDTLLVSDVTSSLPITYTFSNPFGAGTQNISGMGAAGFGIGSDFEGITMNGGGGADVYNINSYKSGMGLAINGGNGNDTVNFGNNNLPANITSIASFLFDGQGGSDTFNVDNANEVNQWTYSALAASIQSERVAGATYYSVFLSQAQVEQLNVHAGSGIDVLGLSGVAAGETLAFHGGNGGDAINVIGNISSIQGPVYFYGGAGTNNLNQLSNSTIAATTVHLDQTSLGAFPGDNFFPPGTSLHFENVSNMTLTLGSGADTVYAQPNATATLSIRGGNPTSAPGDTLNLALAGVTSPVISGSPASGNVASANRKTLSWTGFETGPTIDAMAPSILAQGYDDSGPVPKVFVQFSENVSAALTVDLLELINTSTAQQVGSGLMAVTYDGGTNTATFTFPGYPDGKLPVGDYTAKILGSLSDAFGNALGVETPFSFSVLAPPPIPGDVSGDGYVDLVDIQVIGINWLMTGPPGPPNIPGDANGDGIVNLVDVQFVGQHWHEGTPPGGGAATGRGVLGQPLAATAGSSAAQAAAAIPTSLADAALADFDSAPIAFAARDAAARVVGRRFDHRHPTVDGMPHVAMADALFARFGQQTDGDDSTPTAHRPAGRRWVRA